MVAFFRKNPRPDFGFNPDRSHEYSNQTHTSDNKNSQDNYRENNKQDTQHCEKPNDYRQERNNVTAEQGTEQRSREEGRPSSSGQNNNASGHGNSDNQASGSSAGNMTGNNAGTKKRRSTQRTFVFTLTFSKCVGAFIGLCLIVVWSFILGILLGRGFEPEAHIPKLERIMPQTEKTIGRQSSNNNGNNDNNANLQEQHIPPVVIPEEDLASRQSLKNTPPNRPTVARQSTPATVENIGQVQTPASTGSQVMPTSTQSTAQNNTIVPNDEVFTYVYQVAASKNEAASKAFVTRLKDDKHDASIESFESNGVVWYRVLITFHGTPDDVDGLRQQLATHNIERLLLRSKIPLQR